MLLGRDKPRCLLAILELLSHGRLWIKVRNAHPGKMSSALVRTTRQAVTAPP
jgi:hypothetical protein